MTRYTTLSTELNALSLDRQKKIAARAAQIRLEENALRYLREKLGLSQAELAKFPETQGDHLELNTLQAIVNTLGGTIEIVVRFPNQDPVILSDRSAV